MSWGTARAASPPAGPDGDAVRALLRGFSLEVTPGAGDGVEALRGRVPPGTSVYVTHLPRRDYAEVVRICLRLREQGLRPVPHLAARAVPDRATLDAWLDRLTGDAGVEDLLLIAGSAASPAGPFATAQDVLESGALVRHGIRRLAVAGHPEGHPVASGEDLRRALRGKVLYGAATGTEMWLVTQFAFAAPPLVQWMENLNTDGIVLPVRIGLPGPTTPRRLMSYALRCGVGASLRTLRARPGTARAVARRWTPDGVVVDLAAARNCPTPSITGVHLYPFGGLNATLDWLKDWGVPAEAPRDDDFTSI